MSAILAVINFDAKPSDERELERMLTRMRNRGGDRSAIWVDANAALAISRQHWEAAKSLAGDVLVAQDKEAAVVADASLYYRSELRRKLASRGVEPQDETPSHYILAAYHAFGADCVRELEGDFAFVLWDRRRRAVICARDRIGRRPLFYAEPRPGLLLVGSDPSALLAHSDCRPDLDLAEIGIDAAALLFSVTERTCYKGVSRLSGGLMLRKESPARSVTVRFAANGSNISAPSSFEEGAEELLRLISGAVAARLDDANPTAICLSGGWDSPAVFASGMKHLRTETSARSLLPVSFSLPSDDPVCENEKIAAIGSLWNTPIRWLHTEDIPLVSREDPAVLGRSEPWGFEFRELQRRLICESRSAGARVALDGHGGDFLFQVSPVFLADLLSTGRLRQLRKQWEAMGMNGVRSFFHWAVQPLLPPSLLEIAKSLRGGRPVCGYFERMIPSWMAPRFVEASGLQQRAAAGTPRTSNGNRSVNELFWLVDHPHFARVVSSIDTIGREVGVEPRSPLLDERVIMFAASRPWSERRKGRETKRLLRRAMRGLLPDVVLASRQVKTGNLGGYFAKEMQGVLPLLLEAARDPILAQAGVIDRDAFRSAIEHYGRGAHSGNVAVQLLATTQVEMWLRSRDSQATTPRVAHSSVRNFVAKEFQLA